MLLGMDDANVQQQLVRQYLATMAMLKQAIEGCPEGLWLDSKFRNQFWHVAYHAIFYTHLYVQASEAEFRPWAKHQKESNYLGRPPRASDEPVAAIEPYSREDVLEYHGFCCDEVKARVPAVPLEADSGFSWLPFNRFEAHLYNLRHLAHHTGQLADRLRAAADLGTPWVRTG
jgi:hypothetical protein